MNIFEMNIMIVECSKFHYYDHEVILTVKMDQTEIGYVHANVSFNIQKSL